MKLSEIIAEFDSPEKRFQERDFLVSLLSCEESEKISPAYQAEFIAFQLVEDYKSDKYTWGLYYGPNRVTIDDSGCVSESPNRESIDKEVVEYWVKRMLETNNPVLRARYAGLVWEFRKTLTGTQPDFDSVTDLYLNSLIKIVEEDIMSHPMLGIVKAKRAILLAAQCKKKPLLQQAKDALKNLILRHGTDESIGIWSVPYPLIMEYNNIYDKVEKSSLISDLEKRFERLKSRPIEGESEEKFNPWIIKDIAFLLADLYRSTKNKDGIVKVLTEAEAAFDKIVSTLSSLQAVGNYEDIYQIYRNYGLTEKAQELSKKILELGKSIKDEMSTIKQEIEIPKKDMEDYIENILGRPDHEIFPCFILRHIPQKDKAKATVLDLARNHPFLYMFPQKRLDKNGRTIAEIGNIENDIEGNIILHLSQIIRIETIFLSNVIQEGKRRGIFTLEKTLDFLQKTPIIEEDKFPLIERGLVAYFNNDFIEALHLLTPQIEKALRNAIELSGGIILKLGRNSKEFQLRTLNDILRDPDLGEIISEDTANYLRIILTDNRGWNLRNDLCHGLMSVEYFNQVTADRIFHVLLILGLFKPTEES